MPNENVKQSFKVRIDSLKQQFDFTPLDTLQESERFGVYVITHEGEKRVLKIAAHKKHYQNLERDIRMTMFLSSLGQAKPGTAYRIRKVHMFGPGWFISEYFDAPLLINEVTPPDGSEITTIAKNIWAPFIAEVSAYTPYFMQKRPYYMSDRGTYTTEYYKRHDELIRWADTATQGKLITNTEARQTMDYIEGNARMITTSVELTDVRPWDVFRLQDDIVGLVDLERTALIGRQHYDVAWNYLRFYMDMHAPDAARAFLTSFIDSYVYDMQAFAPSFLTAIGMKLLGYLHDTANYIAEADETGKRPPHSIEEARSVLDAYLKFDVRELM